MMALFLILAILIIQCRRSARTLQKITEQNLIVQSEEVKIGGKYSQKCIRIYFSRKFAENVNMASLEKNQPSSFQSLI
jgi:thymidine kinase